MVKHLFLLILLPCIGFAQTNISIGTMQEQGSVAWKVGHSIIPNHFGGNLSVRYTGYHGRTFYTAEATARVRFAFSELGLGIDHKGNGVITLKNSLQLDQGFWISADFDNTFDGRTYLMFGVGLKATGKPLKKKRFF